VDAVLVRAALNPERGGQPAGDARRNPV